MQRKALVWVMARLAPAAPGASSRVCVLLLKRGQDRGGDWQPVTGGVEPTESFDEGAAREAAEETGFSCREPLIDLGFQTSFSGRWGPAVERSFLAVLHLKGQENLPATVRLPAPRLDPSEHTAFQWVTPEEALQRLVHEAHRESLALALRAWVR